jgi:hypothetical protein
MSSVNELLVVMTGVATDAAEVIAGAAETATAEAAAAVEEEDTKLPELLE